MTREEVMNTLTQIGTCEDEVTRRTLLTSLTDEVTNIYNTNETLTTDNERYRTDNDNLRNANMQLFLRVSGGRVEEHNQNEENEKRSYDDLFNEKGELK